MKRLLFVIIGLLLVNIMCSKNVNDGYGEYVYVPAGEFQMGDNFNEGSKDELPVHTVNLKAYYIGKYEVTNSEYKYFIDDGGYTKDMYWTADRPDNLGNQPKYWNDGTFSGGGISGNDNFPVIGVSWYEANAYCKWLSLKTGKTYRLPTEEEWEKAARGTTQQRYPWGNNIDGSYANYMDSGDPFDNSITPVGYYDGSAKGNFSTHNNASPYGAYDMSGNVWEWCSDIYHSGYGSSRDNSASDRIVFRGGCWDNETKDIRSADRNGIIPNSRYPGLGFRGVREK